VARWLRTNQAVELELLAFPTNDTARTIAC
jgi:hypothetical protein